jgi:hypothetical protein
MKTIKRLIKELCPNGVKYVNLSKLISKNTFKQITSAHEFESMNKFSGNIKMLPSSKNYD